MSLLDVDCPVDHSTDTETSLKSQPDYSALNCGVVLAGDRFRRSESGDQRIFRNHVTDVLCIRALGRVSLGRSKPVSSFIQSCPSTNLYDLLLLFGTFDDDAVVRSNAEHAVHNYFVIPSEKSVHSFQ